ncbi:RNA polymerase sigma factor SigJ [Streptomyces sp. NPDC004111]|uniref:RNA polymerase sigma factor SigJ n=1 Tax=Streptomyces sp. NPDC004111 TaxID=3364690 RepID=UPI0036810702
MTTKEAEAVAEFEAHRSRLFSLAYRMLGSASEAEDIVQDTYLRWSAADASAVRTPAAWLTKVMTNLCINHLTSARARRERYVGPWLPEPVLTGAAAGHGGADRLGPLETAEQRESVTFALLTLMERLTPAERAVFVLREAFGHSHREIAEAVGVEEAHSRQLLRRAQTQLGHPRRHFEVDEQQRKKLVERFFAATVEGDMAGLEALLADDVIAWADGGGKVTAARRPILGRDKVVRYLLGMAEQLDASRFRFEFDEVNGETAVLVHTGADAGDPREPAAAGTPGGAAPVLFAVVVPEFRDGLIRGVRTVVSPDKLTFAAAQQA